MWMSACNIGRLCLLATIAKDSVSLRYHVLNKRANEP